MLVYSKLCIHLSDDCSRQISSNVRKVDGLGIAKLCGIFILVVFAIIPFTLLAVVYYTMLMCRVCFCETIIICT